MQAHISELPPSPSQFTRLPVPHVHRSDHHASDRQGCGGSFADAASFDRELVAAMASLYAVEVDEDATATQIYVRPGSDAVTVVAPRFDLVSTVVVAGVGAGASPAVSRVEVLLSAAAFAALAGWLAMWIVR